MNKEILVASSESISDVVIGIALGLLALVGAGIAIASAKVEFGIVLIVIGLFVIVASFAVLAHRFWKRVWFADEGSGFTLRDWRGTRTYDDDDVLSIALTHKRNYVNGELKSINRTLTLWTSQAGKRDNFVFVNAIGLDGADPLAGFITRLHGQHLEEAKASLARGESVLGEGWMLERSVLTIQQGKNERSARLENIVAANLVDDNYSLWIVGQDEPWAILKMKNANVIVLSDLIAESLQGRTQKPAAEPEGDNLGRIIFERSSKSAGYWLFVIVLFALSVCFSITQFGGWTLVGVVWIASVISVVWALHANRQLFRCHEWGVYKRSLIGESRIRYADVDGFTYNAVRHYVNGVYSGTHLNLAFDGNGGDTISYNTTVQGDDAELEGLREHISRVIAGVMAQKLKTSENVRWTSNLSFTPDGIEYRPKGFLGRNDFQFVPYEEIAGTDLQKGFFFLWVIGKEKPVMEESIATKNFFPGYTLLMMMQTKG